MTRALAHGWHYTPGVVRTPDGTTLKMPRNGARVPAKAVRRQLLNAGAVL